MIGMLMSVTMMSYRAEASLRRPSTPSSASVTRRFFTRASANTRSCRIIGESSTIRQEYSLTEPPLYGKARGEAPRSVLHSTSLTFAPSYAEIQESLEAREPAVGLSKKAGAHQRRRGVLPEQPEELVVYRVETSFLRKGRKDGDHPHHPLVHDQGDDGRRLFDDTLARVVVFLH